MKTSDSSTKAPNQKMAMNNPPIVLIKQVDMRRPAYASMMYTVERSEAPRLLHIHHPPLDKRHKKKALRYIQWCENKRDGEKYKNFEKQVKDYVASMNTREEKFTRTFVEYVILEAIARNAAALLPRTTLYNSLMLKMVRFLLIRQECKRFYRGTSPVHHAKIYQSTINDALIEAGVCPLSFACFWGSR